MENKELTKSEQKIYTHILFTRSRTVKRISLILDKDRTSIQKHLKSMLKNGFILREKVICNRGFRYEYTRNYHR